MKNIISGLKDPLPVLRMGMSFSFKDYLVEPLWLSSQVFIGCKGFICSNF